MSLMQQGNYQAALGKFEEAAQLNENDPLFANNAGFAYYKLERYQDSLYWFNKAIEIDPKRAIAYLNLGDALVKLNRNADAREAYKKYLQLAPDSKSAPDVKKKLDALPPTP
jgi:tetratricopeptide (TPR) repeat protein